MEPTQSLISRRVRGLPESRDVAAVRIRPVQHHHLGQPVVGRARRAGLSQSYVSRRVRGVVAWTISDLELIAAELDIPLSAILPVEQKAA